MKPVHLLSVFLLLASAACSSETPAEPTEGGRAVAPDGRLAVRIVLPEEPGAARQAADDLMQAFIAITGVEQTLASLALGPADAPLAIRVELGDTDLGEEGYRISSDDAGLLVTAHTDVGAMYGLYHVAREVGVRYLHPEQTFYPPAPDLTLPELNVEEHPAFAMRGFHEHTQHPIVMSDFLLRPGRDDFRAAVSNYLKWLARNGQNALFFHALKTMDLDAWAPYMQDITAEAHALGIKMGAVTSFADEQQHNFKLIKDGNQEAAPQIRASIDSILAGGLDYIELQLGTSEFTKPADAEVLSWIETALDHIAAEWPGVKAYAWIHITCSLEDDSGGRFFHLPLQSPAALGAFVHTTMFYTLTDPAPVYDCEDFTHQIDFLDAADGERELVFFPESAWWLGFDNNLPLVLPLTGWSRQKDIEQVSSQWDVTGHVTFTSGREWTYWQYDHYLTRATWDADLTFDAYLDWIAPLYGAQGEAVADALQQWTSLQRQHVYEQNPLIYFYLAGELPQDEAGAQAGVLARRPKLPFKDVLGYDDAAFAEWKSNDYDLLQAMRDEYAAVLATLPASLHGAAALQQALYDEVYAALWIYVQRIEHALALYGGVIDARAGDEEAALARLATARGISAGVVARIQQQSAHYRYPPEVVIDEKPDSLTAYPFGYLHETQSGFFWTRRDDQLAALIEDVFSPQIEEWTAAPDALYAAEGDAIALTSPDNVVASSVLGGFVPRLLFGVTGDAPALTVTVAQDRNENALPDLGTELALAAAVEGGTWTATPNSYIIGVHANSGEKLAELELLEPTFTFAVDGALALGPGTLEAEFESATLVQAVMSIVGIDQEGIENLVKDVFGIEEAEPLPERLAVGFSLTPTALEE